MCHAARWWLIICRRVHCPAKLFRTPGETNPIRQSRGKQIYYGASAVRRRTKVNPYRAIRRNRPRALIYRLRGTPYRKCTFLLPAAPDTLEVLPRQNCSVPVIVLRSMITFVTDIGWRYPKKHNLFWAIYPSRANYASFLCPYFHPSFLLRLPPNLNSRCRLTSRKPPYERTPVRIRHQPCCTRIGK